MQNRTCLQLLLREVLDAVKHTRLQSLEQHYRDFRMMDAKLERLLGHLCQSLDPAHQQAVEDLHRKALCWQTVPRLPVAFSFPLPPELPFQLYPHSEIFTSPGKMLFNELVSAWDLSIACRDRLKDDLPVTIRANFGTVLVASQLGARVVQVEDNPPWVIPFDSEADFRKALKTDPLDFSHGWCWRAEDTYGYYSSALSRYPVLKQLVRITLPDLQGPMDTAEMLRGGELFTDLYTDPALVEEAFGVIASAQVALARRFSQLVKDGPDGFTHQHGMLISGHLLLRSDTAILISPQMYRQQVKDHDQRVLAELGGGGIHSCGNVEHLIPDILQLDCLTCLDFGEAQKNDLDAIYKKLKKRRCPMVRVRVSEEELVTGSVMKRFPTGATLVHEAASVDDARRILNAYIRATEG